MRPKTKLVLSGVTMGLVAYAAARPLGPVPALGTFLDPANGVWGVAYSAELPDDALADIPGLQGEVEVVYDDRRVPHIFASTVGDAQRALGFVVARDRLFQLEAQTRATAGTLTEIAGAAAISVDRQARRLGLAWAAERHFEEIRNDPGIMASVQAFSDGVNAYIDSMSPSDLPLEYHLMGRKPMRWEPIYTAYILKQMGYTLAYGATELRKLRVASLVGREAADALLPIDTPIQEPIQPHEGLRFIDVELLPPGQPDQNARMQLEATQAMRSPLERSRGPDGPILGSNNWAIGPSKSASGNAILAGDPHLGLTLPSIWYEAHMVVPGELDVYGVTLPGTPSITIGFNRRVAWTFTNTGGDVLDYYRERLDDDEQPTRYRVDGEWRPLETRIEEYRGRDGTVVEVDTMYHTHRGPVVWVGGQPMSLRWTVLEDQAEIDALLGAATAGSVDEWLQTMSVWHAPTQNGLVADVEGNIAIQSAGFYPARPEGTTGDWYYDGATSRSDWTGALPRFPRSVNPEQGFLASANQQPYDPDDVADYIGADWPSPWRAMTINGLLRSKDAHTAADLEAYQTHPRSQRGDRILERILEAATEAESAGALPPDAAAALDGLRAWNGEYKPDNEWTVLFESVGQALTDLLWDELSDENGRRAVTPSTSFLWLLLGDPDSPWWDHRATPAVEDRNAQVIAALEEGWRETTELYGDPGSGWSWRNARKTNIWHLLNLAPLSRLGLESTAGPELLSPSSGRGTHGASWRMVVEMTPDGPVPRGTYPGGQSGNPVSPDYDDRLEPWVRGELEDLRFPRTADELDRAGQARQRLRLGGGAR